MPILLALALVLTVGCTTSSSELDAASTRITNLEREVARLTELIASLKPAPAPASAKPDGPPLRVDTPFTATCPGGWRELGSIGNTKWSCRSPQPDGDGSWPQCHIVSLRYETAWQPRDYFELAASLNPQLRSIDKSEIAPLVIETHPGFVAVYERRDATKPRKTLASLLVEGDSAYVTSCETSAASFSSLEPTFRRAIESVRFSTPR
jgi:hypothetical protein